MGEEDEDVREDVAQDEEGPGVDHVGLTGSQEVHRAGVEISLVHISKISTLYQFDKDDIGHSGNWKVSKLFSSHKSYYVIML